MKRMSAVLACLLLGCVAMAQEAPKKITSKIWILEISQTKTDIKVTRHIAFTDAKLWEAPNWSPDGKYLLANSGGKLYRLVLDKDGKATPEPVALDEKYVCNNDHAPSPDGKLIAISAWTKGAKGSQVYLANADGSSPKLLTENAPSYFHGWSPDGKWLAFVGERGGNFDIYRVPLSGGPEERLTTSPGYDDGPDYSPDGKWIYINSDRSGSWDVWRFPADGAGENDAKAERITSDEWEDWFPHPSPDGKWLIFLSFPKGTKGHDARIPIKLRMMAVKDGNPVKGSIRDVADIFGGQGTINVNSWAPDSKRFAFVEYEIPKEK